MILAIFGKRHSGKTTAAEMFSDFGFQRMALADPLKDMLLALPCIQEEHVRGDLKEVPLSLYGDQTCRYMMQTLGTEWRNLIDPEMWLKIWKFRAETSSRPNVICDDGRFRHELEFFQEMGATTVMISRPETDGASDAASEHESERFPFDTDDFDYHIVNDGSLDFLQEKVRQLVALSV